MSHVFISYSHTDQDFVSEVIPLIEEMGFRCWADQDLRAGENWKERIDEAIEKSFALIVFMTPAAKKSEYVTYEWSYALGTGVIVIPILLQSTPLHPKLDDLQYLNFTEDITAPLSKLAERLKELEYSYLMKQLKHWRYLPRMKAIKRLAELGLKEAVPQLIYVMWHDRSRKMVRPTAAEALEEIGTPEALTAVEKWRKENNK